jgi:ribosomal protein L11 methyltransferase
MWLQFTLTVDRDRSPLIETLFEGLGAQAVTLDDAGDEPMLEPGPGETPIWPLTRVTGLFAGDSDVDALRQAIGRALSADVGRDLVVSRLEERAWERAWLDDFGAMRFGDRLWIRPSGCEVAARDAVVVDLDPGLAFGTGTHPTTALCLTWLDRHPPRGQDVVDFGCGSGILAIAAAKLGAARVHAVDHDPQALLATTDNARRNGVDACLRIGHAESLPDTPVDLVIANILSNVLVEQSDVLVSLVRPGGQLVLAGLLETQTDTVQDAFCAAIAWGPPLCNGEWALLQGTRR